MYVHTRTYVGLEIFHKVITVICYLTAGTLCLHTENIKLALCTEAKGWRVAFGRAMNTKYQRLMEEVSSSLEEWTKKLGRPLNDLDDIREVMAALKEIRENEIRIDMSLEPIEVERIELATDNNCVTYCTLHNNNYSGPIIHVYITINYIIRYRCVYNVV